MLNMNLEKCCHLGENYRKMFWNILLYLREVFFSKSAGFLWFSEYLSVSQAVWSVIFSQHLVQEVGLCTGAGVIHELFGVATKTLMLESKLWYDKIFSTLFRYGLTDYSVCLLLYSLVACKLAIAFCCECGNGIECFKSVLIFRSKTFFNGGTFYIALNCQF